MDLSIFAVKGGMNGGSVSLPPNPPSGSGSGWDVQGEYLKALKPILDDIEDLIVRTGGIVVLRSGNQISYTATDADRISIAIRLYNSYPYPQTAKLYRPGTKYYSEFIFGFQQYPPQTKGPMGAYKLSEVQNSGFIIGDPVWVYNDSGEVVPGITTNVYISGTPSFEVLKEKQRLGTFSSLFFGPLFSLAIGVVFSPSVDVYYSKVYEVELVDGRLTVATNIGAEMSVSEMVKNKITQRSVLSTVFNHWTRVKAVIEKASDFMLEEFKSVLSIIERYKIGLSETALANLERVEVTLKGIAQNISIQIATLKVLIADAKRALSTEQGLRDVLVLKVKQLRIV